MMTMIRRIAKAGIAMGCLSLMLSGCNAKNAPITAAAEPETPECAVPASKLTEEAFREARQTLADPECAYQFDAIWNSLLQIAAGDPDPVNKERFSNLAGWARSQGIISTVQAKEYYTRYFHHNFVTLPDSYRTCSYCPQLDTLKADLNDELRQKELGLNKVSKDNSGITRARSDYKAIDLILTATCEACGL